jgi:hypothetical protein
MNKKDIVTAEVSVIVAFLYYLYHLYILVSDILSPPSGRFGPRYTYFAAALAGMVMM